MELGSTGGRVSQRVVPSTDRRLGGRRGAEHQMSTVLRGTAQSALPESASNALNETSQLIIIITLPKKQTAAIRPRQCAKHIFKKWLLRRSEISKAVSRRWQRDCHFHKIFLLMQWHKLFLKDRKVPGMRAVLRRGYEMGLILSQFRQQISDLPNASAAIIHEQRAFLLRSSKISFLYRNS